MLFLGFCRGSAFRLWLSWLSRIHDVFLAFELGKLLRPRESAAEKEEVSQTSEALGSSGYVFTAESVAERGAIQASVQIARTRRAVSAGGGCQTCGGSGAAIAGRVDILVVPDGEAAVRISQISGVRPGTLYGDAFYPAVYRSRSPTMCATRCSRLLQQRERAREAGSVECGDARGAGSGLAVTVRYRIDPRRLIGVQVVLPQPIDQEIVAPVVSTFFERWRSIRVVRDIFAIKREEFRRATQIITTRWQRCD